MNDKNCQNKKLNLTRKLKSEIIQHLEFIMDGNQINQSYRQSLRTATGALLVESGFDASEKIALESLTELLLSFVKELGRSSRAFCELACRTEVLGADVMLALCEMGFPPVGVREYALRLNRKTVGAPIPGNPPKQTSILHTGDRKRPPKAMTGVLEGLPDFPDSHSFVRTPTHKQPQADYESVREKAANQKRDVERALSRFIAKTCGKTHSLFNTDDTNLFPLISCADTTVHAEFNTNLSTSETGEVVQVPAYVNALIFRDQIFEEDDREYQPKPKKPKIEPNTPQKAGKKEAKNKERLKEETLPPDSEKADPNEDTKDLNTSKSEELASPSKNTQENNPFMRPVRLPRNALCLPPACK